MLKRLGIAALMLALVGGAACSKKEKAGSTGGPQTYTIQVDAKKAGQDGNYGALAYFPPAVTVHAGDSITFAENWEGEPHSATFGRLVDLGLPKADAKADKEPPELAKIPQMVPDGPGDANPVAANPCFIASGPLVESACNAKAQPEFNGKDELFSSGFIPPDQPWTMKLSASLAPGTYSFFCDLHREAMTGKITVVAAGTQTQTPEQVTKAGDDAINEVVAKHKSVHDSFMAAKGPQLTAGAPLPPPTAIGDILFLIDEFAPADFTTKVNTDVTWQINGFHTISFNPTQEMNQIILSTPNGVHLNVKAAAPTKAPQFAPTKQTGNVDDGGTWDGSGTYNTGILPGAGPPGFLSFKMKFSKPGTYKYQCLIHTDMKGTIAVS